MKVYKIKRFSFLGKTKAGLKGLGNGVKYGAVTGSVLFAPVTATMAMMGKKKAAGINAAIGASLGAGIGGYIGMKDGIEVYNYQEKLKNDPEFRASIESKRRKELNEFIETELEWSPEDSMITKKYLKKFEKEFNVSFKDDLYSYVDFYRKFYNKNFKKWYSTASNLSSMYDFDESFYVVFPSPTFNEKSYKYCKNDYLSSPEFDKYCMVCGDIGNSDHSWLYYHFDKNKPYYSFPLGYGFNSSKISKCLGDYSKQWKSNLMEIKDSNLLEVARIHNQIIDEFVNGLKQLG
jgi:hypothetical protein